MVAVRIPSGLGRGDCVTNKQKQCLLAYLGYYSGDIDGIWGEQSKGATVGFQLHYMDPEDVDGIFGATTEKRILEVIATGEKPKESVNVDTASPDWWKDIRYFTRDEFKCKCGGQFCDGYPAEMQEAVVRIADAARAHFGRPAHVISGLRCQQWNAHEGGVANSQHMYGEAIDLRIDGVDSEQLRQFVSSCPGHRYSYRINSTNVHFDIDRVGR